MEGFNVIHVVPGYISLCPIRETWWRSK